MGKRTKQRLIRMLMVFIFTLTYRGGEASFGRETADQQQDGEPGAGAGDNKARSMHCKYLGYFCFLVWIQ